MSNQDEKFYENQWAGQFGTAYTKRVNFSQEALHARAEIFYRILELDQSLLKLFSNRPRILEIGCNLGHNLMVLHRLYKELADLNYDASQLIGIDINKENLKNAHDPKKIIYLSSSCRNLPFIDYSMDIILTAGLLIHLPLASLYKTFSEIHRLLPKNSFAIFCEYNLENYKNKEEAINYRDFQEKAGCWRRNYGDLFLKKYPNEYQPISPITGTPICKFGFSDGYDFSSKCDFWILKRK